MSDDKKGEQGSAQTPPDQTKFVPKEEYEAQKSSLEKLQADLERAKTQLLDPEYLEYLESKKNATVKKTDASKEVKDALSTLTADEIERLPKSKLVELAEKRISERLSNELRKEFGEALGGLRNQLQNLIYEKELAETKVKHPDFVEFEKEIRDILTRPGNNYTYEDAYFLAKAQKGASEPAKPPVKTEKRSSGEKPSSTAPATDFEQKDYKDGKEAGNAALAAVRAKYGIEGDIL